MSEAACRQVLAMFALAVIGWSQTPSASESPSPPKSFRRLSGELCTFRIERGIVFRKHPKLDLKLDLYLPDIPGPHPVMVIVHGGGWQLGWRFIGDAPIVAKAFAREGIACAAISYRLAPRYVHPAQFDDVEYAIRWLRANGSRYGLDGDRVAIAGASAGGHLAALTATREAKRTADPKDPSTRMSGRPECAVSLSGPLDLEYRFGQVITPLQAMILSKFLGVDQVSSGEELKIAAERALDASPKYWITEKAAPVAIVQGDADPVVPIEQATSMARALAAAGVDHECILLKDGGHGTYLWDLLNPQRANEAKWWQTVRTFVASHLLKDKEPRPAMAPKSSTSRPGEELNDPIR